MRARYGLMVLFWGALATVAAGQDTLLIELYGRGVHAYNSHKYADAVALLTEAIDAGSDDPRVFYFRGLANKGLGKNDLAKADMRAGALLEAEGGDRDPNVGRALERVQGSLRIMVEDARREGLLSKRGVDTAKNTTRYENLMRASAEVERGRTNNPVLERPEAKQPETTDPFPNTGETLPAAPATVPMPLPRPMPVPDMPPANDPFAPAPGPAPMPAPAPAPGDNDPFGPATPAPMPAPAPAPGDNDPFGPATPAPGPAPMPAPGPTPMPAPGGNVPGPDFDPFAEGAGEEGLTAPAPVPAPANDPFAPAPGPAPAPVADDPFAPAPVPGPGPAPMPAPGPAPAPVADDPFAPAPAPMAKPADNKPAVNDPFADDPEPEMKKE